MADDYTLVFLGELAAGLLIFCSLAGYAYIRIKTYKKKVGTLTDRLKAVEKNMHECRNSLDGTHKDLEGRLSTSEMDHAISLFSMHVLHQVHNQRQQRVTVRRHANKPVTGRIRR
ncbi:hypothetical protein HY994_05015 [Candidatus Micrarchaeota archaeon]|nr:hypothetical protein [Candidatus Micrarchaeota archaeon]